MKKLTVLMMVVLLPGLLLGCQRMRHLVRDDSCDVKAPYHLAHSTPLIRSPDGLPTANTRNGLKVPEKPEIASAAPPFSGCLDQAPKFYATVDSTAAKKSAVAPVARPHNEDDSANLAK